MSLLLLNLLFGNGVSETFLKYNPHCLMGTGMHSVPTFYAAPVADTVSAQS